MSFTRTFFTLIFALGVLVFSQASTVNAAIQCAVYEPVSSESVSTPVSSSAGPRPLEEILEGEAPADRGGATEITEDDPNSLRFKVVFAGENILRCLDNGNDRILIDNATSVFQSTHFSTDEIESGSELILADTEPSVYTGSVLNPIKLADGRFLVDFVALHDELWISGEMVFVEQNGEFYLDSTWLTSVRDANAEVHNIQINSDGISPEEITIPANAEVHFVVDITEEVTFSVSADTSGEVVWEGHAGAPGPEPQYIFYVADVEPGDYTATIVTSAGETEVSITIEP